MRIFVWDASLRNILGKRILEVIEMKKKIPEEDKKEKVFSSMGEEIGVAFWKQWSCFGHSSFYVEK